MKDRLFMGVVATGIKYADRGREVDGDYAPLGILFFDTLELKIERNCPPELEAIIRADAAEIQARKGEEYPRSSTQTITLGYAIKGQR